MELRGPGYKERTLKNVTAADGTAIIYFGELEGGAEATAYFCIKTGKPYKLIDGNETSVERAVILLSSFVEEKAIRVLNVAGPRATSKQQAYADAYTVVARMLHCLGQ